MRTKEELTSLFSTYFGDKLSPTHIDTLVCNVMAAVQDRRARTHAAAPALAELWSAELA